MLQQRLQFGNYPPCLFWRKYNKAYFSGARADLISAFHDLATLEEFSSRIEAFVNNNDLLKETHAGTVFKQSELQQKVNIFIEVMREKYGEDEQYKYIVEPAKNQKYEPMDIGGRFQGGKFTGWLADKVTRLRVREMEAFKLQLDSALLFVATLRCWVNGSLMLQGKQGDARILKLHLMQHGCWSTRYKSGMKESCGMKKR
jgi:hypothetical protein